MSYGFAFWLGSTCESTYLYSRVFKIMYIQYVVPLSMILIANVIFWFKGNSKALFEIEWSPFRWWLTIGLLTDYLTLLAWWKLIHLSNVWRAGVLWGVVSLFTDLVLNSYYFGFNWRGMLALILCLIAALIAHS